MDIAADELLDELERIDATLDEAVRRAAQDCAPDIQRRLQGHLRRLRPWLCQDGIDAASDAMDAAQRVMISADPAAPMLVLAMARKTLSAVIRRQAASIRMRAAA